MLPLLTFPNLFIFFMTFIVAFLGLRQWNKAGKNANRRRYPPCFPSLPLVGSLPYLIDLTNVPEIFMRKSKELGPIFTVQVGSRMALVLNNHEVIIEALLKQSLSYAGREMFYGERYIFNKNRKGIAGRQFDAKYRKYHNICMSVLKEFGFGVFNLTESLVFTELEAVVDELNRKNGAAFNPRDLTLLAVSNVMSSVLFGKRQEYSKGLLNLARLSVAFIEKMDAALDVAPILRFIPKRWKNLQVLKQVTTDYIEAVKKEIRESQMEGSPDCFIKRFLQLEGPNCDEENLTITLRELASPGADTMLATFLWSFVLLANHPAVQDRMQKEIDEAVPRDRFPSLQDKTNLPYVGATMLEIMRIRTVVPLSLPHLTLKDTEVGGYFVPSGVVVFPNLYAANMDPNVFAKPDQFRPERFLDAENKIVNNNLVMSFSVGRRACLAETMARQEFFLFISCLVQRFTILPPEGMQTINVDYCGQIVMKPAAFEVRMIPREV